MGAYRVGHLSVVDEAAAVVILSMRCHQKKAAMPLAFLPANRRHFNAAADPRHNIESADANGDIGTRTPCHRIQNVGK